MEKEFLPYKESLELRNLGFDEPCLAWFSDRNIRIVGVNGCALSSLPVNSTFSNGDDEFVTSPTWGAAFKWFRKKHKLVVDWNHSEHNNFGIYIGVCIKNVNLEETIVGVYKEHEEAELECLRKLINMVKNGN